MVAFYLIFVYQQAIDLQFIYTNALNTIAVPLINLTGITAVQWGIDIIMPPATLRVAFGCNGLEAILIFTAGVLAYDSPWKTKLEWLLKGIVYLSILNLIRIVLLAHGMVFMDEYFHFLHDYVTQDIMIFIAILMFFVFTSKAESQATGCALQRVGSRD